ncbi:MAG: transposase [Planctomycetes bacterium]|jgi:REP element-mobilizing transposase RayT|nr:transposase [Planctomycetota bacterium]
MPRIARAENLGDLHHVWARAVPEQVLFHNDEDKEDYLAGAEEIFGRTGTRCVAWCLMSNHIHFGLQTGGEKLSRVIHALHTRHAVRFNTRWERRGSLFDGRFGSRVITDDKAIIVAVEYVLLNAPRAHLCSGVDGLADYRWSGYRELMGLTAQRLVDVPFVLGEFRSSPDAARRALRSALIARLGDTPSDSDFPAVPLLPRDQFDLRLAGETGIEGTPETTFRIVSDLGSANLARRVWENRGGKLDSLLVTLCGILGARPDSVRAGRRRRAETEVRSLLAHIGCDRLRIPLAAVARATGVAPQSISRARDHGRRLMEKIGVSLEEILEWSIREATSRTGLPPGSDTSATNT